LSITDSTSPAAPEIQALTERLRDLEKIIERGLSTFIEVGNALLEIRDSRLYRDSHPTFEGYCRERWQIERAHAYRLIAAADAMHNLSPVGDTQPTSESQIRSLTGLEPEQQREAWEEAIKNAPNGKPTAKDVDAAVDQLKAPLKPDDSEMTIKQFNKLTKALVEEFATILHRRGLGCGITFSSAKSEVEEVTETECGWRETAMRIRGKITINFYRERNRRSERITALTP